MPPPGSHELCLLTVWAVAQEDEVERVIVMRRPLFAAAVGLFASTVACGGGESEVALTTTVPPTTVAATTVAEQQPDLTLPGDYQLIERPEGCPSEPGSATDLAAERPMYVGPGLAEWERWTDEAGCEVRLDVISMIAGPDHCGWGTATLIGMGTPIGTPKPRVAGDELRTFIWDPDQVLVGIDETDRSISLPIADLPGTAVDTGFRHDNTQLWLDDDDPSVAYLVADGMADRLVIDEGHRILCL